MQFGHAAIHVTLLGPLRARRGPRTVDLGPTKQRAVFAMLALNAGEIVSGDSLLAGVWGADAPPSSRHLLHTYIARIRRAFEPEMPPRGRTRIVVSHPTGYQLLLQHAHVDADRFLHLVNLAGGHLEIGGWARSFELLGEALRLWHDPLLTELTGLLHATDGVDRLRRIWTEAALQYVTIGIDHGLAASVLPVAERLAAVDPLHEEVQARYLTVLEQTGQRPAAIEHFGDIRARLTSELGVEPGPALSTTYQHLLRGDGSAGERVGAALAHEPIRPPWRGVGPGLAELINPEPEQDRLVAMLAAHRLVTIAGPPGCGKSTLALRSAAQLQKSYSGGVTAVDLTDCRDGPGVYAALLGVLGADDDVITVLGDREMLLVFDNAEYVVDACAGLIDRIVRACPYTSLLVTSRELLGLPYETLYRVRPLPLPDRAEPAAVHNPAVRLFAIRAAQVRPGFSLDAQTLPAVVAICRALDGVPLAIELAAASLATDSLAAVLDSAEDPLHHIRPRRRGSPAHHRSLDAALRRSLDTLTVEERRLFTQLGSLPGGIFTIDDLDTCDTVRTREVLGRLVEKSLLSVEDGTYRMLGIMRRLASDEEPLPDTVP